MMKRIKLIYTLLLAIALPMLTACSSDDMSNDPTQQSKDGEITVHLRVSQAGTNTMRAGSTTLDSNAKSEELMNVWTVVVTDGSGRVQKMLTCQPDPNSREIDPIEQKLEQEQPSTYRFYSFANISPEYVKYLLGITSEKPESDNTFPNDYTAGDILDITPSETTTIISNNIKDIGINGNNFDVNAADNGFLSQGIPMSNVQEYTNISDGATLDLIVVRLLAKIELWVYNDKDEDLEISSITLTDITKNASDNENKANLKLFPNYTIKDASDNYYGANEKVDYAHGDIQPNLTNEVAKEDLIITPSTAWTISSSRNQYDEGNGTPVKITFYVNESKEPEGENWGQVDDDASIQKFNHYFLKINIEGEEEALYTLIDDKGKTTNDDNKWNYIARNDYRIIPIVLNDYKLDMIPYDFPAIGVLPASVKEEDGIYTINFHDYGHFHLVPQVKKGNTVIPYGTKTSGDYWVLANNVTENTLLSTLRNTWGAWTDAKKETSYTGGFYHKETTPTLTDGDEVGGEPVWYLNAEGTPRWSPETENPKYDPFIFGYIADPFPDGPQTSKLTDDQKVYHEFTINLYKNGVTPPRTMTYRLYMILDTDQMLYRGNTNGAPRVRRPHCTH